MEKYYIKCVNMEDVHKVLSELSRNNIVWRDGLEISKSDYNSAEEKIKSNGCVYFVHKPRDSYSRFDKEVEGKLSVLCWCTEAPYHVITLPEIYL